MCKAIHYPEMNCKEYLNKAANDKTAQDYNKNGCLRYMYYNQLCVNWLFVCMYRNTCQVHAYMYAGGS